MQHTRALWHARIGTHALTEARRRAQSRMPGLTRAHPRTRTRMSSVSTDIAAKASRVQVEESIARWRRLKAEQQQSAALGEALLAMEATDVQQVRRAPAEGRL
eukprot:3898298-Pleurochrysis_carterae.AAC.1